MYRQKPTLTTQLEALDELSDVQMTLGGAATFAMALSKSSIASSEALSLISCLLDYCALTVEASRHIIEGD